MKFVPAQFVSQTDGVTGHFLGNKSRCHKFRSAIASSVHEGVRECHAVQIVQRRIVIGVILRPIMQHHHVVRLITMDVMRVFRQRLAPHFSTHFFQQLIGVYQIAGLEAFSESIVHLAQQLRGFVSFCLGMPKASEVCSRPKLE